jgi:type III restriction enzyme
MKNVGLSGDYLGNRNRQVVFAAFNTLLRKKPKSVQLKRKTNLLIVISTQTRDCESMSVLGLRSGDTIFYTDNYTNEIVNKDSLQSLNELIDDDSLPRSSFVENINPYLFKTPVDIVFTAREPERKFVQELIRPENCIKTISWIKSRNQNFYSIEYSLKKGSHASIHNFNPDFFILLKDNGFEYISVVEIKSDGDDNDENKQKYIYACIHFNELNEQLEKARINQKYYFNFLSPANYSDYFAYLNDGRLIKGLYKSELDILLERAVAVD